jgi:crossover junction endodeoxyribonuclease RuvC
MVILGIDPGTNFTGYGVVRYDGNSVYYLASGVIKLSKEKSIPERLKTIFDEINRLLLFHKPDGFSIETAFYGKNVQSALKIGYARGVALLSAAENGIVPGEYSPREIKKAVVGNGNASKEQVKFMVAKLLSIDTNEMLFDETDALAAAICHAFNLNSRTHKNSSWKKFVESHPERIVE